ncbi:MAG: Rrf2 family transcriptional regulator [Desulfomonile tiedjei]|uniref:Rrf2 family transcriptional regulator n=1 Tax=Desulfomonile tiedjei TaxID=2358 RepID=A0A9D6Z3Y3_9BACT|nr:Rrf2 family transcriptional regulator [Desulfomonile tiedjei]
MKIMKMMDIRERIMAALNQKPGDSFSISQIARTIGSNSKATSAALGKLLKNGLVDRPQKGFYSIRPPVAPAKVAAAPPKRVETIPTLSLVTIDLLVEGEKAGIDVHAILQRILEDETILDAKVRKIAEADRTKLKIRLSLPD